MILLRSRTSLVRWLSFLLLAIVASAQNRDRIDCFPDPGADQATCEARGCKWTPATPDDAPGIPWCYMQAGKIGYTGKQSAEGVFQLSKNAGPKNPWGEDFPMLTLTARSVGNGVLNIRIEPPTKRYEPALDLPKETIKATDSLTFVPSVDSDPFSFAVTRGNGRRLFDTSIGGLIFSDKFIQIAGLLPSENLYGFGEHSHHNIKHDFSRYTTWAMFARDQPPNAVGLDTMNLYGVQPFYLLLEPDGNAHGVFFINSNAQEALTLPAPALVYRTIGGLLDVVFFPGPSPADVTQQYLAYIGRPFLPAYWAFGYQLCRYGYKSLDEMKERVGAVRAYGIPFDVAYADIDYMERSKDFTIAKEWKGISDYVRLMHNSWDMHSILMWDPAIEVDYDAFQRGLDQGASFIEWERKDQVMRNIQDKYPLAKDTQVMLGVVWPDWHVAFPDFFDPANKTQAWWISEFVRFHQTLQFDGAWIDMNEPSVFGTNDDHPWYYDNPDHPDDLPLRCPTSGADAEFDMPPYKTQAVYHYGDRASLASNTLCMHAMTSRRTERLYNTKNLYGWAESRVTQQALHTATGKRGAVIGRSTFPSFGRFAGHWLGDNTARWEDLRSSIIGVQEFNFFGIPYVGADVCGFIGATEEELCLRWHQAASFHSFYRNHNTIGAPPQDPAVWPSVAAATIKSNTFRYQHLPYLFSIHFRASLTGTTVARPVFFEYPRDSETYNLSEQFMWGPAILVAPVLYKGATTVEAYIPSGDFYSLYDYKYGQNVTIGRDVFPAPTNYNTPTFVRGGYIVPRQKAEVTTVASRRNPFSILIVPGSSGYSASGDLFWDDGESIITDYDKHNYMHTDFIFNIYGQPHLTINTTRETNGLEVPKLSGFEMFAYPKAPNYAKFTLNGVTLSINTQESRYNSFTKVLTVAFNTPIDFSRKGEYTISWSNDR